MSYIDSFLPDFLFSSKAEELTLTVGQAFDLAYRRFLEKKSNNQETTKKLSAMEERIKTAEEEKEALKQKIAKLELAAGQGTPTSNGSTEVSHGAITWQIFDKFLWNLQPDSMSCKVFTLPPPHPQNGNPSYPRYS